MELSISTNIDIDAMLASLSQAQQVNWLVDQCLPHEIVAAPVGLFEAVVGHVSLRMPFFLRSQQRLGSHSCAVRFFVPVQIRRFVDAACLQINASATEWQRIRCEGISRTR